MIGRRPDDAHHTDHPALPRRDLGDLASQLMETAAHLVLTRQQRVASTLVIDDVLDRLLDELKSPLHHIERHG